MFNSTLERLQILANLVELSLETDDDKTFFLLHQSDGRVMFKGSESVIRQYIEDRETSILQ